MLRKFGTALRSTETKNVTLTGADGQPETRAVKFAWIFGEWQSVEVLARNHDGFPVKIALNAFGYKVEGKSWLHQ